MFKELFPPFKITHLEPSSTHNRKLQNAERVGRQMQDGAGTVQNSEPWIWSGIKSWQSEPSRPYPQIINNNHNKEKEKGESHWKAITYPVSSLAAPANKAGVVRRTSVVLPAGSWAQSSVVNYFAGAKLSSRSVRQAALQDPSPSSVLLKLSFIWLWHLKN